MENNVFIQLGVSLALGLLVGLQRERTGSTVAGIRTFPMFTVFGTVCAWLAATYGGWVMAAGLMALAVLLVIANLAKIKSGDTDPGLTTEIASLLLFGLGACVANGWIAVAASLGGIIALLLQFKKPMHQFVAAIGEVDIKAIMQFVLVALVILPVLPNRTFGPYAVINPFKIWMIVVLIVSISVCGYVMFKFVGQKAGSWLSGILGGLISSTATTVSYARRAAGSPDSAGLAALVIMIASTVVYGRVIVLMGAVAPHAFLRMAPPLIVMLVVCIVIVGVTTWLIGRHSDRMPSPKNPAELKSALIFGGLYAVVLLAVAVVSERFGTRGLYSVAALSGLTDMDAITLSTAQLAGDNRVNPDIAWRAILIASMSNIVFKGGLVAVLGNRQIFWRIAILFSLALLTGGALLWFWPEAQVAAN